MKTDFISPIPSNDYSNGIISSKSSGFMGAVTTSFLNDDLHKTPAWAEGHARGQASKFIKQNRPSQILRARQIPFYGAFNSQSHLRLYIAGMLFSNYKIQFAVTT